tara:strand:+ start:266 stop:652 length:387 start_codon:yes stop_codon:yes gene_type:complete
VLVNSTRYGKNGEAVAAIDPNGIETRWVNDAVGRRIRLLEGIECSGVCQNVVPEAPRITEFAYNADGQMIRLTLFNDETGNRRSRMDRFVLAWATSRRTRSKLGGRPLRRRRGFLHHRARFPHPTRAT